MRVTDLYRYPVKGLSPEALNAVDLAVGETMPFDRAYAIENGPSGFDPDAPRHLPKMKFLMLMRNGRLAALRTHFRDADQRLDIEDRHGRLLATGALDTEDGRAAIEAYFAEAFADELRGPPKVLRRPGHSFSDVAAKVLHLVNRASLDDLGRRLGRPIDARRFRPNLVVEGLPAYAELNLVGQTLVAPGLVLKGMKRTVRCAATEVDPETGVRDVSIPRILDSTFGHSDFGIYVRVETDGRLAVGDEIEVAEA